MVFVKHKLENLKKANKNMNPALKRGLPYKSQWGARRGRLRQIPSWKLHGLLGICRRPINTTKEAQSV